MQGEGLGQAQGPGSGRGESGLSGGCAHRQAVHRQALRLDRKQGFEGAGCAGLPPRQLNIRGGDPEPPDGGGPTRGCGCPFEAQIDPFCHYPQAVAAERELCAGNRYERDVVERQAEPPGFRGRGGRRCRIHRRSRGGVRPLQVDLDPRGFNRDFPVPDRRCERRDRNRRRTGQAAGANLFEAGPAQKRASGGSDIHPPSIPRGGLFDGPGKDVDAQGSQQQNEENGCRTRPGVEDGSPHRSDASVPAAWPQGSKNGSPGGHHRVVRVSPPETSKSESGRAELERDFTVRTSSNTFISFFEP